MPIGVDGCRGGWAVCADGEFRVVASFAEVLALGGSIAVDIPIGLQRHPGSRPCDRQARRLLGPRRSSVFAPPARQHLAATRFQETTGLSLQGFHLLPKIREVDRLLTPELQERVREAHPELAFARLYGGPLPYPKRVPEGRALRARLLDIRIPALEGARPDDLLDAAALSLGQTRWLGGELDPRGLRMEIGY